MIAPGSSCDRVLGSGTYRLRICPVDATNAALVSSGATRVVAPPVVKPNDGGLSASFNGSGPSSYTVTLNNSMAGCRVAAGVVLSSRVSLRASLRAQTFLAPARIKVDGIGSHASVSPCWMRTWASN